MNFAEQIVYWYLRLNGFLPLTNFVVHRGQAQTYSGDIDMIAIRFPHVSEPIGGQPSDWDNCQFEEWDLDLPTMRIGLIVEVKSGVINEHDLENWNQRIPQAIRRIGICPDQDCDAVAAELSHRSTGQCCDFTLAKLLVSSPPLNSPKWLSLSLDHAISFIEQRMQQYRDRKNGDRMFFSGDLIQYLAWQGSRLGGRS